jgi:hypothetical protein
MSNQTFFDVYLDFGGDENAATIVMFDQGFVEKICLDSVSLEDQKEFLERHDIDYGFLKNSECKYFFVKKQKNKILHNWLGRIDGAKKMNTHLNDTAILIKPYYGRIKLRKNTQQKIKILHLVSSADIDCSKLNRVNNFSYNNSKSTTDKIVYKLITAILESYQRNGMTIDSSKDFKKLIGISDNKEYLTIKFFDEAQAAEFLFVYGDELK